MTRAQLYACCPIHVPAHAAGPLGGGGGGHDLQFFTRVGHRWSPDTVLDSLSAELSSEQIQ